MNTIFAIWMIVGVMFLVVEYFAKGLVFLWAGIAALAVGVTSLEDWIESGILQTFIFVALWVIAIIAWRHRRAGNEEIQTHTPVPDRNDAHKGRIFTLDSAINGGVGDLVIDDKHWILAGPDLSSGSRVRVMGSSGKTLNVREFVG